MPHPFQLIEAIYGDGFDDVQYIIAASGPNLLVVRLDDGKIASNWSAAASVSGEYLKAFQLDADER
jgi:hypothetical protein